MAAFVSYKKDFLLSLLIHEVESIKNSIGKERRTRNEQKIKCISIAATVVCIPVPKML